MKLLIVTPFFPYSQVDHAGGKEVYDFIRGLSVNHEVHLCARIEPEQLQFVEEMNKCCKSIQLFVFKTPPDSHPFQTLLKIKSYRSLATWASRFARAETFDIIQVEHTETGLFFSRNKKITTIIDAHDVLSKLALRRFRAASSAGQRLLAWLALVATRIVEKHVTAKFDIVFTRSKIDRDILLKICPNAVIEVIPHPVHLPTLITQPVDTKNEILFIGAMFRKVNVKAALFLCQQVMPLLRGKLASFKVCIAGSRPPRILKDLATRIKNLEVTGYVDNLEDYYRKASVFVTPLFIGGGIITKNIEAMALGIPVITSKVGNEGIQAMPGRDILIAESPGEFADAILTVLHDRAKAETLGRNGRAFVEKHFLAEAVIRRIESVYHATGKGTGTLKQIEEWLV